MIDKDYYGNGIKWFIGVVEDTNDSLISNRVKVRIHGIHPQLGKPDIVQTPTGTGSGSGSSTTQSGTLTNSPVDEKNLPNSAQLNTPLGESSFTLQMLTIGALGSGSKRACYEGIKRGMLTPEIIKNLANLAQNTLEPIKKLYKPFTITSGWRPIIDGNAIGSVKNHPNGFAADIQPADHSSTWDMANWINNNLRGKFNFMILEYSRGTSWVHVQNGGSQGSLQNPLIQTYVNGTYTNGLHVYSS